MAKKRRASIISRLKEIRDFWEQNAGGRILRNMQEVREDVLYETYEAAYAEAAKRKAYPLSASAEIIIKELFAQIKDERLTAARLNAMPIHEIVAYAEGALEEKTKRMLSARRDRVGPTSTLIGEDEDSGPPFSTNERNAARHEGSKHARILKDEDKQSGNWRE